MIIYYLIIILYFHFMIFHAVVKFFDILNQVVFCKFWAKSNHNFGHPLHLHLKLFTTRILWKLFQFQIGILWIHQSVTETNCIRGPIKKFVLADFRYEISPPVRNEKSSFQWNDFIAIIVSFFLSWLNNQLQLIS